MCEFCINHGEGKTWYLQWENYSNELMQDEKRRAMVEEFFTHFEMQHTEDFIKLDKLKKAPFPLKQLIKRFVVKKQKAEHYGQILPLADVEKILGETTTIVRVPCACRRATIGKEVRNCFGISMRPLEVMRSSGLNLDWPDFAGPPDYRGLETLTQEEALEAFRKLDKQGLFHSIWTFMTPFIGGICNCDSDCMAFKATHGLQVPVMFKAEYYASMDWDRCNGCRLCMRHCHFGAIRFTSSMKKCSVDPFRCYGCGVCMAACERGAIRLLLRSANENLAKVW